MFFSVKKGPPAEAVQQGVDVAVINANGMLKPRTLASKGSIPKLMASALAIPSVCIPSHTNAAVAPTNHELSLRFTEYRENEMPSERVTVGSDQRYSIDILQFSLISPLQNQKLLKTYIAYETMSGASPLKSQQNDSEQTEVLMSGASIEEKRIDANISLTKYKQRSTLAGAIALSQENDYQSLAVSLDGSIENNNQHLTLIGSLSASSDELSPTDPEGNVNRTNALNESKRSLSAYLGFNRIINKYSTIQLGLGFTQLSGYLSDPYRITDVRPDERNQNTVSLQYRTFHSKLVSSIHFDYRYYQDDWELQAHTVELSVWKDVAFSGFKLTLIPNVRYYWQHQASFYDLNSASTEEFQSSDFRLSAYGSVNFGLDLRFQLSDLALTLGATQYISGEDLGLSGGQSYETPSLVNFSTLSFGIDYKF